MSDNMIILPMPMPASEPERCPKCRGEEDIKNVCRHCNHEYVEEEGEPLTGQDVALLVLVGLVGLWVTITVGSWLANSCADQFIDGYRDRCSLVDVFSTQGQMLKDWWVWVCSFRVTG